MDWFERITGFVELPYEETQRRLSVEEGRLRSLHTDKTWAVGRLETPNLGELRQRVGQSTTPPGKTRVNCIRADVRQLHADASMRGGLFQVASQFNLLEMVSSSVTPEQGVTGYENDHTQGPACAMAAGAGTIYRNYLMEVAGQPDVCVGSGHLDHYVGRQRRVLFARFARGALLCGPHHTVETATLNCPAGCLAVVVRPNRVYPADLIHSPGGNSLPVPTSVGMGRQ